MCDNIIFFYLFLLLLLLLLLFCLLLLWISLLTNYFFILVFFLPALDLSENSIGMQGAIALGGVLRTRRDGKKNVVLLSVAGNRLIDAALAKVLVACSDSDWLETLDVSGNIGLWYFIFFLN